MLFRNLTYDDLKKLQQIDSHQYLQHNHFTSESIPNVIYSNGSETIKTRSNKKEIAQTIKDYINRPK